MDVGNYRTTLERRAESNIGSSESPEVAAKRILCDKIWRWAGKRHQSFPNIRRLINTNGLESARRFCKYCIDENQLPKDLKPEGRLRYFAGYCKGQQTKLKEI